MEYSSLFVTLMGIGTVFFGPDLHHFPHHGNGCDPQGQRESAPPPPPLLLPPPRRLPKPQGTEPEIVAAITAALSEEVGISSRSMNIVNIKKKNLI